MVIKKCKKCGENMHEEWSPKISSISEDGKIPKQVTVLRCKKGHTENYK